MSKTIFSDLPPVFPDIDEWEILYFNQLVEEDTQIWAPQKSSFLGLCFNLGDAYRYGIPGLRSGTLYKGLYNFIYLPQGSTELKLKKGEYSSFCIQFTPAILKKVAEGYPMLENFLVRVEQSIPAALSNHNIITTPEMSDLIQIVIQNRHQFTGVLKRVPEYSKVIELLFTCLENIEHQSRAGVRPNEAAKIMKVYDYLLKHSDKHLSVELIADMAEMNKRRFERCFKILYRKTVHQFHLETRLKKSAELLTETSLPIKEISISVGYKKLTWFCEAFKKQYGRSPGQYRKVNRL